MNDLIHKLKTKSAVIGIIGLGYVGVPLAIRISEENFKVIGFDIVPELVDELNRGFSAIKHISHSSISEMIGRGFSATMDFSRITECDAIIICVPTPLNKYREPNLEFVENTMRQILPYLKTGQVLSLESTTWPGTTREILKPYVSSIGLVPGENFYLLYSPEREDPGNELFSTRNIPKIVGGLTEQCLKVGVELYNSFIEQVVPVSSTEVAEMAKLLENIHRSVNIGLVNEMKVICHAMGIDVFEVIDAAKTKPFGFTAYYPGPGIGGHCIPIDPFYLTWKAREYGLSTKFIELAGETNAAMPQYVVKRVIDALNDHGKALKGSKLLILGISYKRDVDDCRESPSIEIMEHLRRLGAQLDYSDPNVPVFPNMREHSFELESVDLTNENIANFDAVVLLTDHSKFDYERIHKSSRILIDTRGYFRHDKSVVIA